MQITGLNAQSINAMADNGRLLSSTAEVVVYTETAATTFVQQKVTKLAHQARKHVTFGKDVGKRVFKDHRDCNTKGKSSGAAILSKFPLRATTTPWTEEAWKSCRVADSFIITETGPILVIALYGCHQNIPDAEAKNEALLREAAARSRLIRCPTVLVGDINCDIDALAAWSLMQQEGWKDGAAMQHCMDGLPIQKTFKDISRLDYILYNDLAAPAFRSFFVSEQAETDHRSVSAIFDWGALPKEISSFRMPMDLRDAGLSSAEVQHAYLPAGSRARLESSLHCGDVEEIWSAFCQGFEDSMSFALQRKNGACLDKKFRGRGKGYFNKQPYLEHRTPRARHGEFQPSGDDDNVVLRQRIRQIRRLETYVAQSKARNALADPGRTELATQAAHRTWRAILCSSGFPASFQHWWLQEHSSCFPLSPPDVQVAEVLLQTLKNDEVHWRSLCTRNRQAKLTELFKQDWQQGGAKHYRAIKPPGLPVVDSLAVASDHRVQFCRSRKKGLDACMLCDDELQCVRIGAKWTQGKAKAYVSHIDKGKIFLRHVTGNFRNGLVTQSRVTANPVEILKEAEDYWKGYWNNPFQPDITDTETLDSIALLPRLDQIDASISAADLDWAISKLAIKKARGMDGFSNFELKYVPIELKPYLVRILNLFTTGTWPKALMKARMALLYKTEELGQVASTRPITILASVYRLWAKIATKKIFKHIGPHLPRTLYGSVPGRSSNDMVGSVQMRLEKAIITGQPLFGVSFDFSKAYNTLPRGILQLINQRLGLDSIWTPYSVFLNGLERHFTCGQAWGRSTKATTGVPEGCPIAVVQMIMLTWLFTATVRHRSHSDMYSYVDDWMVLSESSNKLQSSTICIDGLSSKFGLILSLKKSSVFATSTKLARQAQGLMNSQGIPIGMAKNVQGLGVNFQTAATPSTASRNKRWDRAKVLLGRLQYMPWSPKRKTDIICRAILPLALFGCQNWYAGKDFVSELRAKCNHAVWGKIQYHLHFLCPIFSGTLYEPQFYLVKTRFHAMLRALTMDEELVKEVWRLSCESGSFVKRKTRGMISILQNQLHDLGWEIKPDGQCSTTSGWCFSIWDISVAQFLEIAWESWEGRLLQYLHTKEHLGDLVSFSSTRSSYPEPKDPNIKAFMKKALLDMGLHEKAEDAASAGIAVQANNTHLARVRRKAREAIALRRLCGVDWVGKMENGVEKRYSFSQEGEMAMTVVGHTLKAAFDLSVECTPQSMVVKMQPIAGSGSAPPPPVPYIYSFHDDDKVEEKQTWWQEQGIQNQAVFRRRNRFFEIVNAGVPGVPTDFMKEPLLSGKITSITEYRTPLYQLGLTCDSLPIYHTYSVLEVNHGEFQLLIERSSDKMVMICYDDRKRRCLQGMDLAIQARWKQQSEGPAQDSEAGRDSCEEPCDSPDFHGKEE
ncbi:unnamed protein product [Symbiodinium sp. CCMP2592]|nr:unnamed protein product [Symbiodinium sp. CCMP2592]